MLVFVRFPSDTATEPGDIESAVLGSIGRDGSVIGASATSVDVELHDSDGAAEAVRSIAAALRAAGLPPATYLDLPGSGQRFSIYDF